MSKSGRMGRYAAAIALFLGASSPALAQNLQNAGSIGQRLPGELVSAGINRQQNAIISPRITPEITEQAPTTPSPRNQFFVEALQTIFTQLNQALLLWSNVLRAQLGGAPLLPPTTGIVPLPTTTPAGTTTGPVTGPTTTPDAGAGSGTDGSTTSDPGVADPGGVTTTGQLGGFRSGQRARGRRAPGNLRARWQLRPGMRPSPAATLRQAPKR